MALETGLIALHHFNNSTVDATGNGNDLILGGASFNSTTKKLGSHSIACDEIDDYARIDVAKEANFDFNTADPFSMAWWVYPIVTGSFRFMVNKANANIPAPSYQGIHVFYDAAYSNQVQFSRLTADGTRRDDIRTTGYINLNQWNCIFVTCAGGAGASTMKIYLNNSSSAAPIFSSLLISDSILNDQPVKIAWRGDGYRAAGYYDELAIWNTEKSADDAAEYWNGGDGLELTSGAGMGYRRRIYTKTKAGIYVPSEGLYVPAFL